MTHESMAGRAIGYRQAIDYLTRADFGAADAEAFSNFLLKFGTATRNYATQQIKWFRKDPSFLFVSVHPDGRDRVTSQEEVAGLLALSREEYEARLAAPAQSEVRDSLMKQGKQMRTYATEYTHLRRPKDPNAPPSRKHKKQKVKEVDEAVLKEGEATYERTMAAADACVAQVRDAGVPLGVAITSSLVPPGRLPAQGAADEAGPGGAGDDAR